MAKPEQKLWRWSQLRGYSQNIVNSDFLECDDTVPGLGRNAQDVVLYPGVLATRRPSTSAVSLTSGPSAAVHYMAVHRTNSAGTLTGELWAFSNTSSVAVHRNNGGGWSSVSLIDTPSGGASPYGTTLNNKFFLAYNSAENRLHLWDGSAVRRVGLIKPSAPTVADTGAGAYAANARLYRVSFLIVSGSDIVVESELSSATAFTPSGGGTAARVTKPTTVDSATHWRVWGLAGSTDTYDLYELISGNIAVGTTTYDDSTAPASYDGQAPAPLGMHIPPPSFKYMVTDGNRLLGAGAWESSASAGQTTPKYSRVWYTRVLGSSDIGDDETIPNVEGVQKNWIDVGENDGDIISGLGMVGSVVCVFKTHSTYALYPTGIDTAPYRAELLSNGVGLRPIGTLPQRTIVAADNYLYFPSWNGFYRFSPLTGMEPIGVDIGPKSIEAGAYDAQNRRIMWLQYQSTSIHVYAPDFAVRTEHGMRGGWTLWSTTAMDTPLSIAMWESAGAVTNIRYPHVGGSHSSSAKIEAYSSATATDASGTTYTPFVTSPALRGDVGAALISAAPPIVELNSGTSVTMTVAYLKLMGSDTIASASMASGTLASIPIEGLEAADAPDLSVKVTWSTAQTGGIRAVVVPYKVQERRS